MQSTVNSLEPTVATRQLADFWGLSTEHKNAILLDGILSTHARHFAHNAAYRRTVSARGVGAEIQAADLPRLLRPTAQTFKSYIEVLGSPFPQDQPAAFLDWLADQLSIELPRQRFGRFRQRYSSLEALLQEIEKQFAGFGLEILTSSGTSGRSTIMVRDQAGIDKTVESFYLCFQRYLGMQADHRAIFIMPKETRIAMVRMATFSFKRVGLPNERLHFTIPFSASPDQVRIRTGRTFQPGWRGEIERRLWYPFMNWANDHYAMPQTVRTTKDLLLRAEIESDKVLLFGGWVQLHLVARELLSQGRNVALAPGSLIGTGGGFKERYPFSVEQIRNDLGQAFSLADGSPIPMRDVYGMAEGNWAAMQCQQGNYHIPPWVYAATLDSDDRFQEAPKSTGLLAFYDPFGGGDLFPAFFKTTDQVTLVNGARAYDPALDCPCGETGAYLPQGAIQRVDLMDEAGCAAQL
ncbi:MAG: hypothetical protein AB1894_01155 [Chloroflexota bacterium]